MRTILHIATATVLVLAQSINMATAQQDPDNLGGIISRYGSNSASSLQSVTTDPDSHPLLRNYSTVSDEVLQNPPAADWLIWRRTYDNMGYSPLAAINLQTVADLELAWRQAVTPSNNMPTPLVHDGVMFLYSAGDVVLAMDATNGELLWRYRHDGGAITSHKFGISLHEDKVLVPTSDLHMVALDARSGGVIWDHAIDTGENTGYALRSAPLTAGGQVIQGVAASRVPGGGFIIAVDLETGEESWRFNTLARPGEPGGNTWNNIPLEERRGGSVWNTGGYDPELDLVFFGVSPTYNTGPFLYPLNIKGVSNDALYTNATLALRPATGELVWYYQHIANDQFDLDWIFERSIVELEIDGEIRKAVVTAGKPGLFDALDAATGQYLFSVDPGIQNIISAIDPVTGTKFINPDVIPDAEMTRTVCPLYQGGRNWPASAIDVESKFLFVPMFEVCMDTLLNGEGTLLTSGLQMDAVPIPGSDGNFGRLQAIDLERQELAWQHRQVIPPISATLATAGGLVFVGYLDHSFKAFDQQTGEIVWETELDAISSSFPISYSVDGKQYIALVAGQLNLHTGIWLGLMNRFAGHIDTNPGEAALWVFALD
ncbi:MAG: PQQ-binding-like beta-propeller repeat protein [Gammaproteobacteria bacterium]|nr:PQQ-binding-like beta-propeller repeat protein [Gammaproteobacteria bacterium]MDP7154501.1 PQQ-binding-like beta-propeller repeat protein [Gammaproteobacteria bacterium]HJO10956.1 PQQ-binding-like beta-propeller repeat protein [Gammaproteobacteria bacterium]